MRIVTLNDNRVSNPSCKSEHGISLYIEVDGHKMLMDLGQSDLYKQNAKVLGIDLSQVDTIVLSHGHYDHARGLHYADKGVRLICHPNCCIYRYSTRTNQYGGIGYTKEELEKEFKLIMTNNPYKIYENVYFLGTIPRKSDFEGQEAPMTLEDGSGDYALDDSSIVIDTEDGLVVISGCAHSGICNTVEYAKEITGKNKVYAVIGGFHLKNLDDHTNKTIEYFRRSGIDRIVLAHCTSDEVCSEFKKKLANQMTVEMLGSGKIYEMSEIYKEMKNI